MFINLQQNETHYLQQLHVWALLDEEAQTVRHFSKRPFVFVVAMLSLYKKKSFTGKDGGVVQTIT